MPRRGQTLHIDPFPIGEVDIDCSPLAQTAHLVEDTLRKTQALGAKVVAAGLSWLGVRC